MSRLAMKLVAAVSIAAGMTYAVAFIGSGVGEMTGIGGTTACSGIMTACASETKKEKKKRNKEAKQLPGKKNKDMSGKKESKGTGEGKGTGGGEGKGTGGGTQSKQLPCGDYDGVPSHNDCRPVSKSAAAKCQKFIDQGNATNDPAQKEKFKNQYIACVG